MKLKSFTIIEVLIATTIFVCVVALSAASYGMVIKSNKNSREQNTNMECLSHFGDLVPRELKGVEVSPFIWGVQRNDTKLEFSMIDNSFPDVKQYTGLLIFRDSEKKMIFFSGDGLYSLAIADGDLKRGFVNSEGIDKEITNLLPSGCKTNSQLYASKSAEGESFMVHIKGDIFKGDSSVKLPVDMSVSIGDGI